MINLAKSDNLVKFVNKLSQLEQANTNLLNDWERNFIKDLRKKFDTREDAQDLGISEWNPSVSQWNMLGEIWRKIQ